MEDKKIRYAFEGVLKRGKVRACLIADKDCSGGAIESHSIQNSFVLSQLAEDGHVFTLSPHVEKGLALKLTGRNIASTYPGFCAFHDTKTFSEIDFKDGDLITDLTIKQMIIFFLRVVAIEGWKKQSIINSMGDLVSGLEKGNFEQVASVLKLEKQLADKALVNPEVLVWSFEGQLLGLKDAQKSLGKLLWQIEKEKYHFTINKHWVINSSSDVAVANGLSPVWDTQGNPLYANPAGLMEGEEMGHMGLTVFESNGKTHVLLSYFRCFDEIFKPLIQQIEELVLNELQFKRWLTAFILENCENVVFRPSFINSLTIEQKGELEEAGMWNLMDGEPPKRSLSFSFFR